LFCIIKARAICVIIDFKLSYRQSSEDQKTLIYRSLFGFVRKVTSYFGHAENVFHSKTPLPNCLETIQESIEASDDLGSEKKIAYFIDFCNSKER
jgi:hypothetical protein